MAKVALITGASQGIGAAIVRRLVQEQFTVLALGRNLERLQSLHTENTIAYSCDVGNQEQVTRTFQDIGKKCSSIDILVNAAGVGYFEPIEKTSTDHWTETIEVNLTGSFRITKEALPFLKRSASAHIFNICSSASRRGFPNCGAYAASKFGLLGFTEVLREELRSHKIKVTAIIAGAVHTPFWDKTGTGFDTSKMIPPDDVAQAVFFASQQSANNLIEEIVLKPATGDF